MRLFILSGAASALVVAFMASCGGSDFTGQATQPLPDASAGGSAGEAGTSGASGANGASGDSGSGGDSGHGGSSGSEGGSAGGGSSGSGGDSGSGGSAAGGVSGTTAEAGGGSGGVNVVDASADANCASPKAFFPDIDGDGFGTQDSVVIACEQPPGAWVTRAGDCNDARRDVNPEQREFSGTGYDTQNAVGFDYDCNGREEPDPSQFGRAPDCTGLNLGACSGSGFGPTNRTGPGIDPLCGSTALVQCKVMDLVFCGSVVSQVAPKRCR